ncbi:MAG: redox-regulated ATPase YchF, partial [Planctomycetes bacterium]|nr:redox-regulated ATPase YchF [Planctomycetota bacterium]
VGIAGFAGSGKSTVFQWLTEVVPDPAAAQRGQIGMARIPDERLDWLSAHFRPKKTTPATIEFLDTPGLLATERRDNPRRLSILREAGGLLVVLTGFGSSDLVGELRRFREELLFADLEIVLNRITRLEDQAKKPKPPKEREADQNELDLLRRITTALEQGQFASAMGLKEEEEKGVRSFQLLTLKPLMVLVNVGDDRSGQPLPADLLELAPNAILAPAKLELELEELPAEDREAFMAGLGLEKFSRGEVLRAIYYGMGQQVFFTVGEDECRAWSITAGEDAVAGAGKIHTDLAKRFVRAEVVSYEDFRRVGSMKEAKTHGVYRLEGKTYIVRDGDIMHIL